MYPCSPPPQPAVSSVTIDADAVQLQGELALPGQARGGRPDLAGAAALPRVTAPTLLIVGGHDPAVIALNREAYAQLGCVKTLHIVPGATHLFEEPGTLEQVAALAADWFVRWLRPRDRALDG